MGVDGTALHGCLERQTGFSVAVAGAAVLLLCCAKLNAQTGPGVASGLSAATASQPGVAFRSGAVPSKQVSSLPEAPVEAVPDAAEESAAARADSIAAAQSTPGSAGVHGVVLNSAGGPVSGALVLMRFAGVSAERAVRSGPDGRFDFAGVPEGAFTLQVSLPGFVTRTVSATAELGKSLILPQIAIAVAPVIADAQVFASVHDVAAEQVRMQEQQRVLGFVPNFYITYAAKPARLSAGQKFNLAWRSTVDPMNFVLTAAVAGLEQSSDAYAGYGQGASGYGKRYGAAFADGTISTFIGGAALPVVLHQDPRYFWKGTGTVRARAMYAISRVVVCKGDNGRWQPNYSNVLGNLASAGISNAYYPGSDRDGAGLTVSNALIGTASGALANLYQEFFSKGMTPHERKLAARATDTRP